MTDILYIIIKKNVSSQYMIGTFFVIGFVQS